MGEMASLGYMEERLGVIMPFIASFHWANHEQTLWLCTMSQLWAQIDLSDFDAHYVKRANYDFVAYLRNIGLFRAPCWQYKP